MTIVTTHYRYKRPPRKRKAVALDVPAIVTPVPMKKQQHRDPVIRLGTKGAEPVNDNADQPRPAAIVTAKNPRRSRFGDVPDMTPEEHKRRGDAADAPRDEAADRREAAQTPARSRAGTGAAMATPRCRASRRRSMNHSAPSRHLPKQFTDD